MTGSTPRKIQMKRYGCFRGFVILPKYFQGVNILRFFAIIFCSNINFHILILTADP